MATTHGGNELPLVLRRVLFRTCKGKMETELKDCIENVLLADDNGVVMVNTSRMVKQELVLNQYGLGKILNI